MEQPKSIVAAGLAAVIESLRIRFVASEVRPGMVINSKAPRYRALISMPGCLKGLVLEAPIFAAEEGNGIKWSVGIPGGRFACLVPDRMRLEKDGKTYLLSDPDPDGSAKMAMWQPAILTAFHAFLQTKNPEQAISL